MVPVSKVINVKTFSNYNSIVEIGCGIGNLVHMIHKSGKTVIGIDSSSYAIKTANELYPECKYEIGDIRTWSPNSEVDMVLVTQVYHRLPKEERLLLLQHIKSYIKPEGALLISYGCDDHLNSPKGNSYPDVIADEIFSVFKKQQQVSFMVTDHKSKLDCSWNLYVGEKDNTATIESSS